MSGTLTLRHLAEAVRGTGLRVLVLDNCAISQVQPGAFQWAGQILSLALDRNPLWELRPGDLDGLTSLQTLSINEAGTFAVRAGAFDPFASTLRILSVRNSSNLTSIEPRTANILSFRPLLLDMQYSVSLQSKQNSPPYHPLLLYYLSTGSLAFFPACLSANYLTIFFSPSTS